ICAEQIPKPNESEKGEIIDPYVKINLVGVPQDEKTVKTKTICKLVFILLMIKGNNGFNPVWNEDFEFKITCLDLAYIRINVFDANKTTKDIFLANNIFPVC